MIIIPELLETEIVVDEFTIFSSLSIIVWVASIAHPKRNKISIRINKKSIPKLIGRNGSRIKEIDNELGIRIDVNSKE